MPVERLKETPSQTGGPFVHIGLLPAAAGLNIRTQDKPNVVMASAGERIRIDGMIFDGSGAPVKDALVELWQADAAGRYGRDGFSGFARAAADYGTGAWWFETVKPGRTAWSDGRLQAPHVSLLIFARGINIHLHTRLYFDDEPAANEEDPALRMIEQRHRADTLVAKREDATAGGVAVYRHEIRLQGDRETVFFDM
jgi:protocatechuate 3,4-dioxygenase alpha subunit